MSKIQIIESEKELKKELLRNFKIHREFEQKAFYLDEGAKNYYKLHSSDLDSYGEEIWKKNYDFLESNLLKNKNEKIAIISLGCGNGEAEKPILKKAWEEGHNISYFGIDSSKEMISLIKKEFQNEKFPNEYIIGDMASEKLHKELKIKLKKYSKRIFILFGNTLGNIPQSYIADVLRNILKKGDILWLDVNSRDKNKNSIKIFERYLKYLKDKDEMNFQLFPLKKINFPIQNGEVIIEMKKEKSLEALNFKFKFKINKTSEIKIDNEIYTFLPEDLIDISEIRVYDVQSLIKFFESRHFKFINKLELNKIAQILLEKN